ncbi:hypothetical protein WJX73_006781 [Symbiochloris irregularis]|uniref:SPX domain-containing protein n=1 Tax=Symbiochloris irregularis TaxID=706552 RepID=A0AAW1NVB6_9CHLO
MKFTKELRYNAVEDWRAHYVNYGAFKKLIYGEEKRRVSELGTAVSGIPSDAENAWQEPLLAADDESFTKLLDNELVRVHEFYVQKRFIDLNMEGFRKALKKHDKVLAGPDHTARLKERYMPIVEDHCCTKRRPILEGAQHELQKLYAKVCCGGSNDLALVDLRRQMGEEVKFDRNTVFKDMVEKDRRTGTLRMDEGSAAASWWHAARQPASIALALAVFLTLLYAPTFAQPERRNCLALLAFASLLWCTEALPLFVTSMLVPFLVVVLRVLMDTSQHPPKRLTPQEAAPRIFHAMMSQVILLLLGGFTIAAALSKHAIAKSLASWVLAKPILRTLDAPHPFAKSLVIGIALASNLGGMTSPISSPQNLFAIERMSMEGGAPSWLSWFAVALPIALLGNLLCWGLLRLVYRDPSFVAVRPVQAITDPMSAKQVYIVAVSVASVVLWCLNSFLSRWTGEMGIIAILPMVAFYGFGILDKDDWNSMLWNVVMLAMGGLALGEAVTSSGLLLAIAQHLETLVEGYGVWQVAAIFCALVLVATTFISHTVGAMVILPIIQSVGASLPDPHPRLLVMAAALMCSGAMGLPVSGFPNMTAVSLEDARGVNYINTVDFLKVGLLGSVFAYVLVVTLGVSVMLYGIGW